MKQLDETGKFPKEMERTMSLHYSSFNLEAFFFIAAMAEEIGIDFWHYTSLSGKSLEKAFNTLKPYLMNNKQWGGQQIKEFDFEEDAYPLLFMASSKFNCAECREAVYKKSGKETPQLLLNLLH